jgi:hypothetical protein
MPRILRKNISILLAANELPMGVLTDLAVTLQTLLTLHAECRVSSAADAAASFGRFFSAARSIAPEESSITSCIFRIGKHGLFLVAGTLSRNQALDGHGGFSLIGVQMPLLDSTLSGNEADGMDGVPGANG